MRTRKRFYHAITYGTITLSLLLLPHQLHGQTNALPSEQVLLDVLKSNAADAEKAITCKRLAIQGTSESVPELARLLNDEKLASWARIALEAIPSPAADEALLKASASLQGKLLVGTINSIGVRRDGAAVDTLQSKLKDSDADVASAAAVALGRIGSPSAIEALEKAFANSSGKTKGAIAEGLVLAAERAWYSGNNEEAIELYDLVRKAEVAKQRRAEATRGAILSRKLEGIPLLLEQLRSPDKTLFQMGLSTARELEGKEVDQALAKELEGAQSDRAALVIHAMADRRDTVDLAAILKATKHKVKAVRLAAVESIGRVGNASCVPPLLEVAIETDSDLSAAAKKSLAEIGDDAVDKEIKSRLPKASGALLGVLIDVVGQRRIESSNELIQALENSDSSIRASALRALGNTAPADRLSVLIQQVIKPKSSDDLEVAQLALKTASVRMPDREACAAQLAQAIEMAKVPTKIVLLDTVAAVGGTNALATVGKAAADSDPLLKDAGSRLLGEWMSTDAASVLLELARTGPNDKYQVRAIRGYIRIARQLVMPEKDRIAMCRQAMEIAKQPAEQKLVVEIYRRYPSLEMLKLAAEAHESQELKSEAAQAIQAIRSKLGDRPEVRAILEKAGIRQ